MRITKSLIPLGLKAPHINLKVGCMYLRVSRIHAYIQVRFKPPTRLYNNITAVPTMLFFIKFENRDPNWESRTSFYHLLEKIILEEAVSS